MTTPMWKAWPCEIAPGKPNRDGYGLVWRRREGIYGQLAHRVEWAKHYGPVPPGMMICHRCDTPACIQIAHLFMGTQAENLADMTAKGRRYRKLSDLDLLEIQRWLITGARTTPLARRYGVTPSRISQLRKVLTP